MKKDDFVTKDIEDYIVSIGYDGILPIEVRPTVEFIESKYPNSILREGYHLWREDLFEKACLKYPCNGGIMDKDNNYYERRNHIVLLAIDEILKIKPKSLNTKDVIDTDLNALKIYLGLGYSTEDAKKAFYKVFGDKSDANKKRCETLQKFIDNYNKINK